MRRKPKTDYFTFYKNLLGYKFFNKNKEVPKFILYWSYYDYNDILTNRTDIEVLEIDKKRSL